MSRNTTSRNTRLLAVTDRRPEKAAATAPDHAEYEGADPLDPQMLLAALRYWWKIATPLAILLMIVAALAIALVAQPKYTASAWLIIREKPEYLLNPQATDDPRKFVQNQMELMRSPPVIDPVANQPKISSAPELAGRGDPADRLRRLLKIRAKGQSDFFVIEFTSEKPAAGGAGRQRGCQGVSPAARPRSVAPHGGDYFAAGKATGRAASGDRQTAHRRAGKDAVADRH